MLHLLLIEDDPKMAQMLVRGLEEEDFAVEVATRGTTGLERLLGRGCEVCILDVLLPDLDGFCVLERARRTGVTTPILMLTARDAVCDRVRGLNLGADDYLVKPFAFSELLARLQALLRRGTTQRGKLSMADLDVDLGTRLVWRRGRKVELSQKQFALLELLLHHRGQVVTRAMILKRVWGYTFDTGTNVVNVHIAHLRQKIERPGDPPMIHTVRGVGYRLGDAGGQ